MNDIMFPIKMGLPVFNSSKDIHWEEVPLKYRTKENFYTFCYLHFNGLDAIAIFQERINELENAQ